MKVNYALSKRFEPPLRLIVEAIYGRYTTQSIAFGCSGQQHYDGWLDFQVDNMGVYYYCAIFDSKLENGTKLHKEFLDSSKDGGKTYDFRPTLSFRVRGDLLKKGKINGLEWAVLRTGSESQGKKK